jgi:hypothetical protein
MIVRETIQNFERTPGEALKKIQRMPRNDTKRQEFGPWTPVHEDFTAES